MLQNPVPTFLRGLFLASVLFSSVMSAPATACVAAFGYTGSGSANSMAIANNVGTNASYVVASSNPNDSLVSEVLQINSDLGPTIINLKAVIFNPNPITPPTCTHYERGTANPGAKKYYAIRGDYKARIDAWFAANSYLFEWNGQRLVYSLTIHDEANNDCVENWVLHLASDYVRQKLDSPAVEYGPIYISAGYGLRNSNGIVSKGFPVNSSGAIAKFPNPLDLIGYSAYDVFDPGNNSNPWNVNQDSWNTLSSKLDQALRPHQKTAAVIRGFCDGSEPAPWDIECPPNWKNWWRLGILAQNWASYLNNDSRNLFLLAFNWPDAPGILSGTESLFTIWGHHSQIAPNCSVSTWHN